MKQLLAFASIAIVATGCAGSSSPARIAVLQNPDTKQTVECRANPWGGVPFQVGVDNCISTYKKAGYVLVADSADEQPTATTQR